MSDTSPSRSSSRAPSDGERGAISPAAGVLVALITAAIVFGAGMAIFPGHPPPPSSPAVVTPPPIAPSTPAAAGGAEMGGAGGAGEAGGAGGEAAGGQGGASVATPPEFAEDAKAAAPADAQAPDTGGAPGAAENADGGEATSDCALPEKDMAREAWRRNWPTICPVGDKGFILIPVKGSIQNAVVELKRKPVREARVNLPQAESQLTLKLYKLKKLGFKELRVGSMDESGGGTKLRVRLMPGAGDPVFEVKDGYVKITVATPEDADKSDKSD